MRSKSKVSPLKSQLQNSKVRQLPVKPAPPSFLTAIATHFRLYLVWGILLAGTLVLMGNLYKLQVTQSSILRQKARAQQQELVPASQPRRPILDRNGLVLAIDRPTYTLYAHPMLFKLTPQAIAIELSPVLSRTPADLLKQFRTADSGIEIEYALNEELARQVQRLQIDGLELIERQQRFYPQQQLFSEVVGYTNLDREGQGGVESAHQNLLARSVEPMVLNRSGDGSVLPNQLPDDFLKIDDLQLQLTLDSRLQRIARTALKQQLKAYSAKRGTVIAMNASNGEILALVTEPTYDANAYYKSDIELLKNWAVSDLYEPGSTFKPINIAIALETGAIQPNSVFNDEGQIIIDGWPIQNHDFDSSGGRGALTIQQILQFSSNVGMVHIMRQLPAPVYYTWLERLGLGKLSGIDLPAEVASQLKPQEQFTGSPVESATTAFGQGFSLTPLQLTQLHAILANGGYRVTPHVVRGLVDPKGKVYSAPPLPPPQPIFSPQTTQAVLAMMESVVTQGTGKAAQIPNYRIAGKTGTAQKAHPQGGYYDYARITSFVGIVPTDATPANTSRYVVLAVIDEPQGEDAFGSTVAAPIVKSVLEALITLEQIPPSVDAGTMGIFDAPGQ